MNIGIMHKLQDLGFGVLRRLNLGSPRQVEEEAPT